MSETSNERASGYSDLVCSASSTMLTGSAECTSVTVSDYAACPIWGGHTKLRRPPPEQSTAASSAARICPEYCCRLAVNVSVGHHTVTHVCAARHDLPSRSNHTHNTTHHACMLHMHDGSMCPVVLVMTCTDGTMAESRMYEASAERLQLPARLRTSLAAVAPLALKGCRHVPDVPKHAHKSPMQTSYARINYLHKMVALNPACPAANRVETQHAYYRPHQRDQSY